MATLPEIRQQYPQYQDMSDGALADAMYLKFYSDMPRPQFDAKIGLAPQQPDIGTATAVGRGAAQGFTLGGYDEMRGLAEAGGVKPDQPMSLGSLIRGGYNMLTGSSNDQYEAGKNRASADFKTAQQQYPMTTMGGELGGALAGGLGLGGVSLGVNAARAGAGLGRVVLGSAVDGSILGGAQGALSADEGNRLAGAQSGAMSGAVIGGVAPVAVSGRSGVVANGVTARRNAPGRLSIPSAGRRPADGWSADR